MEIVEIKKNRRSIIKLSENERRIILDCLEMYKSKIGKEEIYEIDKLKYNVIDQNERINISKLEASKIQDVLHKAGHFTDEINKLIDEFQQLLDLINAA